MQVQVFRGRDRLFAVIEGTSTDRLPKRYGPWTPFKSLDLTRGQVQPGLNVEACLDDLARYGIHVTDAHIRITEEAIA